MANFYIVNALGQNLANSNSSALFWDCCKRPRFVISGYVWATQWPISSELKIKFDPSLDRSWCEFFKILKYHGPKNPPPGCNLGPKFFPLNRKISIQQTDK